MTPAGVTRAKAPFGVAELPGPSERRNSFAVRFQVWNPGGKLFAPFFRIGFTTVAAGMS